MSTPILGTNVLTQVGVIVNDIEAASKAYAEFLGVPVPGYIVTDLYEKTQAVYKGEPCHARAKLAFFHVGPNVDIELIEPDETPSVWRDDLNKKGEGFHHIAFVIKGMQEKITLLAEKGMPLLQKGEYTGGRYAYIDANDALKMTVELLENDG